MSTHLLTLTTVLLFVTAVAPAQAPPDIQKKLEAFVPAAMAELGVVPGLSIAVVSGGKTIYSSGFGVADVEARTRVTGDTVFYTASVAKAFTGMAAAVLASQGKLNLDTPLTTFFPGFRLPEGANARKATVRGLLAHDPGFGNATINYLTTFVRPFESETDLVRSLNTYSQPLDRFTYANTNYALAAFVIEKAAGRPWRDVVEDLVFKPLGMTRTTAFVSRAKNVAKPYAAESEGFVLMPLQKTDRTITGAGGVFSCASDVARFVEANLNGGRIDGRQAIPPEAIRMVQTPGAPVDAAFTYFRRAHYGIGLYLGDYEGEPMPHHFGSITGYRAHMSYMPQRSIGVVVLSNEGADGSRFADLVAAYVYDVLLGRDAGQRAAARITEYKAGLARARAQREAPRASWSALLRAPGTPAQPLADYAGRYRSERLGDMTLVTDGKRLIIEFGDLRGDLLPVTDHEFMVSWRDGGPPERFLFEAQGGKVTGFDWGNRPFDRVR